MELAQQWLESQRGTPSFVARSGPTHIAEVNDGILDAPLPSGLLAYGGTTLRSPAAASRHLASPAASTPRNHRLLHVAAAPVHEELIAKGKLYQQKREALQEKALRQEMSQVRKVPEISKEAQHLKRHEPFYKRFARMHAQKEEIKQVELSRFAKERDEAMKFPFKPKISQRGRRASGKVGMMIQDQHDVWQLRREEYLEAERTKRVVAEMQEVRDTPDISIRSQQLAAKQRERYGMTGMAHVEYMVERDRSAKLKVWERAARQEAQQLNPNPKITVHAASMRREGDVGERLYAASLEAEERKAALIREKLMEEQREKAPRLSAASISVGRSRSGGQGDIADDLMERHLEALAAKEHAIAQQVAMQQQRHIPAINPVSDAIAARLPESSKERLYKPRQTPPTPAESPHRPLTSNYFSTGRSASGRSSSAASSNQAELHEREMQRQQIRQRQEERKLQRMEELRRQKAEAEMRECTFQPALIRASYRDPQLNHASSSDIAERNANWALKRDMRLQESREHKEKADLAPCTFSPSVTHKNKPTSTQQPPHPSIYGGDHGEAWGTDEFVSRLREARQRQEEERLRQVKTGSTWENRTTVPKEFKFGKDRSAYVPALERPIEPPQFDPTYRPVQPAEYRTTYDYHGSPPPPPPPPAAGSIPSPHHFSRTSVPRQEFPAQTPGIPSYGAQNPIIPFGVDEYRRRMDSQF